ncbi:head GIN domain-containing protein [Acidobacteriota bacterium]
MKNYLAVTCCLLFLFISCKKSPTDSSSETIIGSGNLVTQVLQLALFHSVDLKTVGKVNITQGNAQEISITISDNLLEYIQTIVSNGLLTIDVEPGKRFSNFDLTVNLTMTDLEELSNSGAGSINGINLLKVDSLRVSLDGTGNINLQIGTDQVESSLSGAGNIVLSGTSNTQQIELSGAGSLQAFDLTTETTTIILSGAGKVEVSVYQMMDVTISGAGSVYFKGSPTIIQNITGPGSLVNAN